MAELPFLRPGNPGDVIAWRHGQGITRATFLQEVADLVPRLPAAGYVLNHCDDRYHFLVCLAASLLRGQISLFPSSRAPAVLENLKHEYGDVYCLTDQVEESVGMEVLVYRPPSGSAQRPGGESPRLLFPAERDVAIAFTSGSTGEPQRYRRTWGALLRETRVAGRRLGLEAQQTGYVVATVPPQHMYGFVYSVMLPLQFGYVLEAQRPFYPDDIARVLAAHTHPGILVTTPVHIRACVLDATRLPPLAFILSSTAALDKGLAMQAERDFDTRVIEFYGSTETGAIASRRQGESDTWRVFDDIHVSQGEAGFRVDAAYFSGAVTLSDSVQIVSDTEFVLYGRNSDLIKIAGKRVSLGDLNRHLLAIEGVEDGIFIQPDTDSGREPRLSAFVVAPGKSRDAILQALRPHIDAVFLPRPLHLVKALPRNATGKLPRATLLRLLHEMEERGSGLK